MKWPKEVGDHRACLEDIAQNIVKMGVFLPIFRGGPGVTLNNNCEGTMKSLKRYSFTFMRRRAVHYETV